MIRPIKPKQKKVALPEVTRESTVYPVPSYAANIYLHGDKLIVGFPPIGENLRGHTITIKVGETKSMLQIIELAKKGMESIANKAWSQDNEQLATYVESFIPLLSKAYRQGAQFQSLLDILGARYADQGKGKIGTKGAPVNAQILKGYKEKMEENAVTRVHKERMAALKGNPVEMLKHLMLLDEEEGTEGDTSP